jgi:hypothetical protein
MQTGTAQKLLDMYQTLRENPITFERDEAGNLLLKNDFWVDISAGRGGPDVMKRLERFIINSDAQDYTPIIFSGPTGSGKSTELNRFMDRLSTEYPIEIVSFSIAREADVQNLLFSDLLVILTEQLTKKMLDLRFTPADKNQKWLQDWLTVSEIKEVSEKNRSISMGAEAGAKFPNILEWLASILFTLKGEIKLNTVNKEEITRVVTRKMNDLMEVCNLVASELIQNLGEAGKSMIVVIEDLDKLGPNRAESVFVENAEILQKIEAKMVYTFPNNLIYNPKAKPLIDRCNRYGLPMVKVFNKDGSVFEPGIRVLKELVYKRLSPELFESDALVEMFVKMSGGVIRDLLRMLFSAADNAMDYDRETINESDYTVAVNRLRSDYKRMIADKMEGNVVRIAAIDYLNVLKKIYQEGINDPNTFTEEKEGITHSYPLLDLLHNLLVISYNDKEWVAIHPILEEVIGKKNY